MSEAPDKDGNTRDIPKKTQEQRTFVMYFLFIERDFMVKTSLYREY
jgi:hypothetical protein